ncbi:MAG: hypothetical protein CL840_09830 [Crocinitomicaceae bacterium]|nr:hypothetical protein [Crocinitomicaceae bacterium]|tara:strand:+ start:3355 stop:6171 length:2817 start_codon:yes stop_codon:yes gene_type:complete
MKVAKVIVVFIFIGFVLVGHSQTFHLTNFRVKDGMASSQVYDIAQDKKGNLYVATDLGLTKYNGYAFETFSEEEGLSDNSIAKVFVDAKDHVWCIGSNRSFSVFQNNKAKMWRSSDSLNKIIGRDFIRSFAVDQRDNLIIGISQPCFDNAYVINVDSNGTIQKNIKSKGFYYMLQKKIFGGNSCPGSVSNLEMINGQNKSNSVFDRSQGTLLSVCANDEKAFAVSDNQIISIGYSRSYFLESTHSGSSLIDMDGNLWVSTYSGVLFFKEGNLRSKPIHLLKNVSISKIFQDLDGSIWIGTYSKGLYQIKNQYVIVVDKLNDLFEPDINSVSGRDNAIAFSDSRNNLYTADINGNSTLIGLATSPVSDVLFDKKNPLFLERQKRRSTPNTFKYSGICIWNGKISGIQWYGKIYGFSGYRDQQEIINSSAFDFNEKVLAIVEDSVGIVWLGTTNGLYRFDGKAVTLVQSTNEIRVDRIDFYSGNLVFCSRGNGLGFLNKDTLSFFGEDQGLVSNFTNDLFVLDNELWCATNSGATRITEQDTISIGRKDGLPSAEINAIWSSADKVVFGTRKGLVLLDKKYLINTPRLLTLEIVDVNLGESKLDFRNSTPVLPYKQNGISITLRAIDFRIDFPIRYRYRLSNDSKWSYTSQPTIKYASLPTGEWTFYCSAQNQRGEWGPINEVLKLEVSNPYYLEWWFILLVLALAGGITWGIFRWQYAQQVKEEKTQNELNVLKIKALSSQMNPHFIFNSLNSIQTFLVDNDLRMSNKYLTKFARLMRFTLNNSNETFVPLKDVIASLELYMELEQLRFGNKFDFKIITSSSLEMESLKIPSMLIQPFIENAILHGILPLESRGEIMLKVDIKDDNTLLATIRDNGVGRDYHKDKIGKKHKSHGLRITRERLQVFESLMGNKFNLEIRDLKDEEGKPKGTEIELMIPYM